MDMGWSKHGIERSVAQKVAFLKLKYCSRSWIQIADGREARTYDTKRLEGSKTFYEALVAVPDDFFGKVKVSMRPGIADMSGKALRDVQPLSFMRFKKSIIQHTSFNVRDEL